MSAPLSTAPARRPSVAGGYAPLDAPFPVKAVAAAADLASGLSRFANARYLAVETMKNQYRRTVLGPWWITVQSALYTLGLALIFGQIQHTPLKDFLPFVTTGYLFFLLLNGLVRAASLAFVSASSVITSTRQPLTGLVLRDVTVEFLQFGHNAVILLLLYPLGLVDPHLTLLLVPVLLLVTAVNAFALTCWMGPLVARYRDVGPAVLSVLQVIIFFTPVFYASRGLTGGAATLIQINPFGYFVNSFRALVLGDLPTVTDLSVLGGLTLANVLVGAVVFASTRSRIPYWVS
jgi:ABC-2 type transport system permease protein